MYKVLAKYIKLVITELFSIHYIEFTFKDSEVIKDVNIRDVRHSAIFGWVLFFIKVIFAIDPETTG